jgi:DNA-binding MarR family transcriptional regulator
MDRRSDLRECASCTCFAVRRAARTITQHYDRHLRPSGLRATQFTLLAVLSLEGPLPLSRAADRLGLERTTLTRNLRPLKARGLVDEEASGDRRVRMIAITRRGLAAARAALPRWRAAQRSVAGRLDRAALRALDLAARAAIPTRPSRPRSSSGSKEG